MTGQTYEVGKTADLVVHVHGKVTAMTDDRITIAGHALPRQVGDGVVQLSTRWPKPKVVKAAPTYCGDECEGGDLEAVVEAARHAHNDHHAPNWAYCEDAICAAVRLAS